MYFYTQIDHIGAETRLNAPREKMDVVFPAYFLLKINFQKKNVAISLKVD